MIRTKINIREIKLEGKNKPKSRKKSREKSRGIHEATNGRHQPDRYSRRYGIPGKII